MNLITQIKINNSPNNTNYLKDNSHWYKYLNRNSDYLKDFENEMKNKYKLTTSDKFERMVERIDMVSKIIDILQ